MAPLLLIASDAFATEPRITSGPQLSSNTGHVLVTWDADGPVTLSVSRDANLTGSKSLYQGSEQSYFLSGLANGDYYLVVEAANGERSNPVILSVEHQSLTRALWLTLIGAVITLGIVITIMRGARR